VGGGLTVELEELVECYGKTLPVHEVAMDTLVRSVERAAKAAVDGASVVPYGSAINGLWTATSDLDLCLLVPGAYDRRSQLMTLRKLAKELRRAGASHDVVPRLGAQIPILQWKPRRPGLLACDISVNNTLAVANSRLLVQYMQVDDRLRRLGICVKAWARCRNINDRSRGTISSFAHPVVQIRGRH